MNNDITNTWNDDTTDMFERLQNEEGSYHEAERLIKQRKGVEALQEQFGEGESSSIDWETIYYYWDREDTLKSLKKLAPENVCVAGHDFSTTIIMHEEYPNKDSTYIVSFTAVSLDVKHDIIQFKEITEEMAYLMHIPFDEIFTEHVLIQKQGESRYSTLQWYTEQLGILLYDYDHAFNYADIE